MDAGTAGLSAPAGEDKVLPFPGQGIRQPADVQDIPLAEAGAVDTEFTDLVGRRLVGRRHLAERER